MRRAEGGGARRRRAAAAAPVMAHAHGSWVKSQKSKNVAVPRYKNRPAGLTQQNHRTQNRLFSPPALRLSKHQLRGGLETSFQEKVREAPVACLWGRRPSAKLVLPFAANSPAASGARLLGRSSASCAKMRKAAGRHPSITTNPHRCSR